MGQTSEPLTLKYFKCIRPGFVIKYFVCIRQQCFETRTGLGGLIGKTGNRIEIPFFKPREPDISELWENRSQTKPVLSHLVSKTEAIVTALPQLYRYCPLWDPYPLMVLFFPRLCWRKGLYTLKEIIPYKHIPMCFPRRCGIPWNARPPLFGSLQPWPTNQVLF